MSAEELNGILQEYSKKPYVESTFVMTNIGIPIASTFTDKTDFESLAPLVSITYEGAHELAKGSGHSFKQLNVELSNGSRIVVKSLGKSYILAVQVHKYNDRVRDEIDFLGDRVSKYI